MHAFPEVRRAVTRDDVGRACIEEALSTLEGREPDATAKLNLGILVEAIMVGMAGTLRIKYKGDLTRLRARSPTLELKIGGEVFVVLCIKFLCHNQTFIIMGKLTAIAGASMAIVSFTVMDRNLAVGLQDFTSSLF